MSNDDQVDLNQPAAADQNATPGGAPANPASPVTPPAGDGQIVSNTTPTWIPIAGALFAAVTLGFLGYLVLQSANNHLFFCNAFQFFIPFFCLGLGLSAAFLGGWAAANGQFGLAAGQNNLAFSAGGGIAVVVISYLLMQNFAPKAGDSRCLEKAVNSIEFRGIPEFADFAPDGNWYRTRQSKRQTGEARTFDFDILLNFEQGKPSTRNVVEIATKDTEGDDINCVVYIYVTNFVRNKKDLINSLSDFKFTEDQIEHRQIQGNKHNFNFIVYPDDAGGQIKCLNDSGSVVSTIFYDMKNEKLFFSKDFPVSNWIPDGSNTVANARFNWFNGWNLSLVTGATAGDLVYGIDYKTIAQQLSSADANVRITAQRFLGTEFKAYFAPALEDLFKAESDPNLITGILHGLVAGIDIASGGKLTPGQPRDLATTPLPYVAGREKDLFKLAGHSDEAVSKQARRLIQRFPMDSFLGPIKETLAGANLGNCNAFDVANRQELFRAISFYQYNRIIETIYQKAPLTGQEMDVIDSEVSKVKAAVKNCVTDDAIVADTAVMDFGRSLAYQSVSKARAQRAANDFITYLGDRRHKYYFQQHVARMDQMAMQSPI